VDAGTFAYTSEIMPTRIRGPALGLAQAAYWVMGILWLQSAPTAIASISWKFFLIFIIWTAFAILIVYFFYPETYGRSLEDLSAVFGDEVAVHFQDASPEQRKRLEAEVKGEIEVKEEI
jgi:MFS family permease